MASLDDVVRAIEQTNNRLDQLSQDMGGGNSGKGGGNDFGHSYYRSRQDFDPFPYDKVSQGLAKGGAAAGKMIQDAAGTAGGMLGSAAGTALGGPVGGAIGEMIGQKIGDTIGKCVGKAVEGVSKLMADGGDSWEKIQRLSYQTARNMGMAQEQAKHMNKNLRKETGLIAAEFNMTMDEINEIQDGFTNAIGRNVLLSQQQMENAAAYKKILGGVYDEAIESFDDFGASTDTAAAYLELTQERAARSGLNAKKASEAFAKNLAMANKYTFREGVNGVSKMVLLSQKFKFNMESIGTAADRFSDIEKAIQTSANLQVLGGSYAAEFSNPLEMMGLAQTDMEGFTQKILNSVANKGILNKKTGVVEFSPLDKAFMKNVADNLGMSQEELTKMASRQVSIAEIDKHINNGLSKENREAIENLAEFNADTGKYEVSYYDDGEAKSIAIDDANLTDDLVKTILPYTDKEDSMRMDVADIAGNVRELVGKGRSRVEEDMSLSEKREGWNQSEDAGAADWWPTDKLKSVHSWFGEKFARWTSEHPILSAALRAAMGGETFSEGGVVPGADNGGVDNTVAMLAPNEMVLNQQQQSNLYSAVASNPNVDHFSEGGISGVEQQRLFAMANRQQGANQPQEANGGSVLGTLVKGGITFKLANNKNLISALNNFGTKFTANTNKLTKFGGTFTKASTAVKNSKLATSLNSFAKNSKVLQSISNSKVGNIAKLLKDYRFGKASHFGKAMKGLGLLKDGKWGDAFKVIKNNAAPTRMYRAAKAMADGKSSLLFKSLRGRKLLDSVGNVLSDSKGATATASNVKTIAETTKTAATEAKAAATATKAATQGGSVFSKFASGAKNISGGLKGASGLSKLATGAKALGVVGTAINVGVAGYQAYNAISDFGDQKEAIMNDETLTDKQKKQAVRGAEDERNKAVGSAVGGAAGAAIGAALLSECGPIGMAIGGFAGEWVGEKIGGFIGENFNKAKDFIFGKDEDDQLSEEDKAQQDFEEQKYGAEAIAQAMEDSSGESIKILAAQATVKMSDLLTSIWYHMNGKLSNGEEKDEGLLGGASKVGKVAAKVALAPFGLLAGAAKAIGSLFSGDDKDEENAVKAQQATEEGTEIAAADGSTSTNVQPKTTVGESTYIKPVEATTNNLGEEWNYSNQSQDINLNVNGTLKLVGNGINNIDMGKLLNSPEFKRQIVEMVQRGLEERANMGGKRNKNSVQQIRNGANSITQQNSK